MRTSTSVTIYNKYKEGNVEKWHRTVLDAVFWNSCKGANFRKTGLENADSVTVLIPFSVSPEIQYVEPKQWITLIDKTNTWTLQNGDILVKGNTGYDIVKSSKELDQLFDQVRTITKIDAMDFGSRHLQHWEVGGK